MAAEGGVEGLLLLLDAADAAGDLGLRFEREDAAGVEVVEADAEGGQVGGELGVGAVEEEVLLEVGAAVVGRKDGGEARVGGGGRQPELHFYFHFTIFLLFIYIKFELEINRCMK